MTARLLVEGDMPGWDDWLRTVEGSNVRQTSFYRRALELYGHRSEVLVLEDSSRAPVSSSPGSAFVGGALLGIKSAAPIPAPFVHVSGGLALADPSSPSVLLALVEAILDRCADLKASSVEISSRVVRTIGEESSPAAAEVENALRGSGFEPSKPLETYHVNLLRDSDEALLESFGKNKRRDIRKAARDGLDVSRATDRREFSDFEAIHEEMARRKGLDKLPAGFGEGVLHPMALAGHCDLYVARFRGIARNYVVVGTTNVPTYSWGCLAEAAREPGCPPTGEALQYAAMCHARGLGKPIYDLGGTPGPIPEAGHPNYTVWKFKYEFGGRYVTYVGVWKRTLRPQAAALIDLGRKAVTLGRRIGRK